MSRDYTPPSYDDELLHSYLAAPPGRPKPPGFFRSALGCLASVLTWGALFVVGMVIVILVAPSLIGLGDPTPAAGPQEQGGARPTATTGYSGGGGGVGVGGGGGGGGGGGSQRQSTLPSCSTVTDTTTACIQDAQPPAADPAPTPTAEPLELAPPAVECWQGSFYTCEELAEMGDEQAIDAVQTTDQFLTVETLPTAPPAFVDYATNACAAATVKSPLCP